MKTARDYNKLFAVALEPFFVKSGGGYDRVVEAARRSAASVMALFKTLQEAMRDEPRSQEVALNVAVSLSDVVREWPDNTMMRDYGGRFWILTAEALRQFMESAEHAAAAERTDVVQEQVKHRARAAVLREAPFAVVFALAQFVTPKAASEPGFAIRLREALSEAMDS